MQALQGERQESSFYRVVLHDLCENDLATQPDPFPQRNRVWQTNLLKKARQSLSLRTLARLGYLPNYLLCALTLAAKGAHKTSRHLRNMANSRANSANFDGSGWGQIIPGRPPDAC